MNLEIIESMARWTIPLRDFAPMATESPGTSERDQGLCDAIIKGFARASKDRTRSGVPVEHEL
jgi:hypothetical protein